MTTGRDENNFSAQEKRLETISKSLGSFQNRKIRLQISYSESLHDREIRWGNPIQITKLKYDKIGWKIHGIPQTVDSFYSLLTLDFRLDNGWSIKIGRGLDFYKQTDRLTLGFTDFELRSCKETMVDIFHSKDLVQTIRRWPTKHLKIFLRIHFMTHFFFWISKNLFSYEFPHRIERNKSQPPTCAILYFVCVIPCWLSFVLFSLIKIRKEFLCFLSHLSSRLFVCWDFEKKFRIIFKCFLMIKLQYIESNFQFITIIILGIVTETTWGIQLA